MENMNFKNICLYGTENAEALARIKSLSFQWH